MEYKLKDKNKKKQDVAETEKNSNNVKVNNYIDENKDKAKKDKYKINNYVKPPKTNGKLKVEYDDEKNDKENENLNSKKKKPNDVLIDYEDIIQDSKPIPTYKNDAYTSAQLESIRFFRDLTDRLERDIATLTENERQQSDNEIDARKEEAKKQKQNIDQFLIEYSKERKKIKDKYKEVNDKNELFAKDYMEQFMISAAIDEDEIDGNKVLCIKPMVHQMGTMFNILGNKREEYVKQAQKDDTYLEVNQNIINILDRIDEEMGCGSEFRAVRKQVRLFDRHMNENAPDTGIKGVFQFKYTILGYIADKLKRFFSTILSPIWNMSYDNSYKLFYKYNKDLLKILESMSSQDFKKVSRPKCVALYRKILKLENETLILPVSKEKYLNPLKKFLKNMIMENGDKNEDGCQLMIETCGMGNFIGSISKKVGGDNEKVETLMRRYLFENEGSIFNSITCTDELLKLLKKWDGKNDDIAEYFYSKCAGKTIKLNNKFITIPPSGLNKAEDEQYKTYKDKINGILANAYKGTILSASEGVLMKKFRNKTTELDVAKSQKLYVDLRNYIHTMNDIHDDEIDRLNKLDTVYISRVVSIAKKMIEGAKQKKISEAKSFGILPLIKIKIEKMKKEYLNKKEDIEKKKTKIIQKNISSFLKLRQQLQKLVDNPKAYAGTLSREYYQTQLEKVTNYITKQYGLTEKEQVKDKYKTQLEKVKNYFAQQEANRQNNTAGDENIEIYDNAIKEVESMIQEASTIQQGSDESLGNIDNMFNERAKYSFETLKNIRGMMGPRYGSGLD